MWPQIVMIAMLVWGFQREIRHDSQRTSGGKKWGLGTALFINAISYSVWTAVLYEGGFWRPLGWSP